MSNHVKLHQAQTIDTFTSRLAVPNGWIYIRHHLLTDDAGRYCSTQVTSTFVFDANVEHVREANRPHEPKTASDAGADVTSRPVALLSAMANAMDAHSAARRTADNSYELADADRDLCSVLPDGDTLRSVVALIEKLATSTGAGP